MPFMCLLFVPLQFWFSVFGADVDYICIIYLITFGMDTKKGEWKIYS